MKTHHLSTRTQLSLHTNQDARGMLPFASYCLKFILKKKDRLKVALLSGNIIMYIGGCYYVKIVLDVD